MIFYMHQVPQESKLGLETKRSLTPIPMDQEHTGYFADRIYNAHNSNARFYVITFGYSKSCTQMDTVDRKIDRYTLHFIFSGKGFFNGRPVSAGQMFFALQNETYSVINSEDQPLTMAWIALSGTELENQLSLLRMPRDPVITYFQNVDEIERIFLNTIYKEHLQNNMELFLLSRFYEILSLCDVLDRPILAMHGNQFDGYFTHAMTYISTHYTEDIKVPDVARHTHVSVPYLRRICAQKAGKSPQELITEKRLNVATVLLSDDRSSIEEIASMVGFSDTATFSKSFKRSYGISPLAYRKQKKEEKRLRAENIQRTENN